MRIAVCIKQVPVVSALQFDPETKTLKREGVRTEVSSFDVRALLKAVELRQILQITRLMRGETTAQHGGRGKQNSNCNSTHFHRPPGIGALSGIGPV